MSSADVADRKRGAPFVRIVVLLWLVLYLIMMGVANWPWASPGTGLNGVLGFGTVPTPTLTRFGSAVPSRILDGEWARLFTAGALHTNLLSVLLLTWFFASVAKQMRAVAGPSAVLAFALLGGAVGCAAHAWLHPDTQFAAPGPFAWIAALLGLQMGMGLFGKISHGRRLVGSTVFSLVIIVGLSMLSGGEDAWNSEFLRPALGVEALASAFGFGLIGTALLGAPRIAQRRAPWMRVLAFAAVALWGVSAVAQAPRTIRAGEAKPVTTFLKDLWTAERETYGVYKARRRTRTQSDKVVRLINRAIESASILADDERAAFDAYTATLLPIARGDIPDPHARILQAQRAFTTWHELEGKMRRRFGIAPRATHRARLWWRS